MTFDSATPTPPAGNRLGREKSPYLLQHARNPVAWFPWGEEAFRHARELDRPIFLSIGYSTCHWCHVMERESFEDSAVAEILNAHFVSIKVDREERPDVDRIYMTFVQSTTGAGGWPMSCFLTPDRKPFYGGTYFPPESRQGRPGFTQLLRRIAELWRTRRDDILSSAEAVHAQLADLAAAPSSSEDDAPGLAVIANASRVFMGSYDPENGGFGGAPKFPQPSQPAFLLRYAQRCQDPEAARQVLHTCDAMAAGGIHDQLGGGFARYAVDAQWQVPHFEKMLYDNAQLARLYLEAHLVSGEARHAAVARDILDYVLRDLTHPDGGFYSAEDADSEGHEGKFYCWTRAEMSALLAPEEFNVAARYFGVTEAGNFVDHSHPAPLPGQNVLRVADPHLPEEDLSLLAAAKRKLFAARSRRIRPHLDDKILASWNGLMLGAMAQAYAVLGDDGYRAAAERNLAFLGSKLWDPGTGSLYHRWRDGERDGVELLEGFAFLLAGTLDLYETTLVPAHLDFAVKLAEAMIAKFFDRERGGFWQSPASATELIVRPKDDYDGAEPAGNSVATLALLRLAAITGRADLRQPAEATLRYFAPRLRRAPQALPFMLQALDFSLEEPRRAVVAGDPESPRTRELLRAVHSVFQPNKVVLGTTGPVDPFARTLPAKDGGVVYLCTGSTCQPPTADAATVRAGLS